MYTVLIADDEAIIRKGIASIIDWNSLGFDTILQAENGEEALKLFNDNKIDLLLTDIVMPRMDGLELTERVREKYPDVMIAILSGYDDFEYAQQAVGLGVQEYILKPVGAKALYGQIRKITKKMQQQTEERNYLEEMSHQIYTSMPMLREQLLNVAVCRDYCNVSEVLKRAESLDLNLDDGPFYVAAVSVDYSKIAEKDRELYSFAVKNVIRDCIGTQHYSFEGIDGNTILIFRARLLVSEDPDVRSLVLSLLEVIQKAILLTLRLTSTCALGTLAKSVGELHDSYQKALRALECRYTLGENNIYDIQDLDIVHSSAWPIELIRKFLKILKYEDAEELKRAADGIREYIKSDRNLSIWNIRMIFLDLVMETQKLLTEVKGINQAVLDSGIETIQRISTMDSLEQGLCDFKNYELAAQKELRRVEQNESQRLIGKVKEYIDSNYSDPDLSLTSAAEYITTSTGYLSALFKREEGVNFSRYLTNVRMEKAMSLLLTTDKKSYEIALETGFSNPHYFSVSFKKHCGMTPSEYRSRNEYRSKS